MSTPDPMDEEVREVEEDWLPEETKKKVARRRPDYQSNNPPCEACQ